METGVVLVAADAGHVVWFHVFVAIEANADALGMFSAAADEFLFDPATEGDENAFLPHSN